MADYVEYESSGKPHPYHLVRQSIWPLLSSFAGGLLAVGALLYFHKVPVMGHELGLLSLIPGLLSVLLCMFFWWKDIIFESVTEKVHNHVTEIGLKYGMILFIASEVMFFVAFFWAFFDASLPVGQENTPVRLENTGAQWPPTGIEGINAWGLPFLMTMILLLSGCTVTWAHAVILEGKNDETKQALWLTVLLGVVFLCFQVFEYAHATFGFTEGIYPSTFYMATGFHGFHVFIGTVFLCVCLLRAMKKHFTPERHFGFEAAAWYWHFVDVVWLFLFVAIYFWGNMVGVNLK